MKRRLIIIIISILLIPLLVIGRSIANKNDIDTILKSNDYSYLPKYAQNYIKEVYENTGNIILTEKNKEADKPYLNPDYIEYLKTKESSKYGYIPDEFIVDHTYANEITKKQEETSGDISQTYYNLRNEGYISNIYDQGSEGICWAFASATSLESHLAIKSNKSKLLTFSEKQVDYSTTLGSKSVDVGENPYLYTNEVIGNNLNEGGNMLRFINSTAIGISPLLCDGNCSYGSNYNKNKTITDDKYWKYGYDFNSKLSPYEVWNKDNTEYDVNEVLFYNPLTTDDQNEVAALVSLLKEQIINNGSLYVAVAAYTNLSVSYIPSYGETALNTNGRNVIYYIPSGWDGTINHAVSIIGWDDNYTHNICLDSENNELLNATKSGDNYTCSKGILHTIHGAWIVQNSWGSSNTYIYLPYNSMKSTYNSISDVSEIDFDNSYRATSSFSSFLKGNTKESLKKIKFFVTAYNRDINILYDESDNEIIVQDNNNIIPVSGTKIKSIHCTQPGLYTVDLSDQNIIFDNNVNKIKYSIYGSYINYDYYASLHTNNVENDKYIKLTGIKSINENILSKCNLEDNKCIDEPHSISINDNNAFIISGNTRDLTPDDNLTFEVYNSSSEKITNKFHFFRNFSVSNYLNAIVSYNNENIPLGNYKIEVYYHNTKYDELIWNLTEHNNTFSGIGTESNPYIIKTSQDLNNIRNNINPETNLIEGYYELNNDLDLTDDTTKESGLFYNSGKGWKPINNFSGSFEGNNHVISGLNINRVEPEDDSVGLFGNVYGGNNYIKNIIIKDANILGHSYSSALIGKILEPKEISVHDISIINSKVDSCIHTAGGVIGYIKTIGASDLTIYNLFNNSNIGSLNTDYDVGGLIGSYSASTPTTDYHNLTITDVINIGNVYGKSHTGGIIGNVFGTNNLTIKNSFSGGEYQSGNESSMGDILGTFAIENTFNLKNNYYLNKMYNFTYKGPGAVYSQNNTKIDFKDIVTNDAINNFVHKEDWTYPVIDNIKRIPMLKSLVNNFEFTETIDDFEIEMTETKNIYNLISTDIEAAKNIKYTYNNKYLIIDDSGLITPLKPGITSIHINSLYDGYEDDIQVTIIEKDTITYYSNNTEDETVTQEVLANEDFNLIPNTFTYKGYKFTGWNTLPDGSGTSYTDEQLITSGSIDNLQLYAQWEQIEYKIYYYSNDENESVITKTYVYPTTGKITIKTEDYERENYILESWNTLSDGSGTRISIDTIDFDSIPFDINNEIKLYAIWKEITDIPNNTMDFETEYDGKNHNININVGIEDYNIKYSIDNTEYNLDTNPTFKNVGEYTINYKITKLGYNDLEASNKLKIYGIKSIDKSITVKSNMLITDNNAFSNLQNKIDIYSKTNQITHLNSDNNIVSTNAIKTADKIKININNKKDYTYSIAYLGDVNGDGAIGIIDYIRVMKDIMGNQKLSGVYYEAADMNRNNSIDIIDYIRIMKIIMEES